MKRTKNIRASDKSIFFGIEDSGFVVRKRTPLRAIFRLAIMVAIGAAGVIILLHYDDMQGPFLTILVGGLFIYVGCKIKQQEILQHSTEFMNAIFASAIGDNYKFCAVTRRDGEIVYMNRSFQTVFPHFIEQPRHDLKTLITLSGIAQDDGQKIISMVTDNMPGTLKILIKTGEEKKSESMNVSIQSVSHPRGFVLIRGE